MPFVQGQIRGQQLCFEIDSSCALSHRPIRIKIDSALDYSVQDDAQPIVYTPEIDLGTLDEPSIIDGF